MQRKAFFIKQWPLGQDSSFFAGVQSESAKKTRGATGGAWVGPNEISPSEERQTHT